MNSPEPTAEALSRRQARLIDLETGLMGLLHFHSGLTYHLQSGSLDMRPARWYQSAMIMYADMLFLTKKGGDRLHGAAFRALRDLGLEPVAIPMRDALAAPAAGQSRDLGEVISRMRNEVIVHHSFDLEAQGSAMLFTGDASSPLVAIAFSKLLEAVRWALARIDEEKTRLTLEIALTGQLREAWDDLASTGMRARAAEKARRRAQRQASKRQTR